MNSILIQLFFLISIMTAFEIAADKPVTIQTINKKQIVESFDSLKDLFSELERVQKQSRAD